MWIQIKTPFPPLNIWWALQALFSSNIFFEKKKIVVWSLQICRLFTCTKTVLYTKWKDLRSKYGKPLFLFFLIWLLCLSICGVVLHSSNPVKKTLNSKAIALLIWREKTSKLQKWLWVCGFLWVVCTPLAIVSCSEVIVQLCLCVEALRIITSLNKSALHCPEVL